MPNFEKIRSLVDDLKKVREVKIARIIKELKPTDNTIDVSAFTDYELNYYRNMLGGALQVHKKIQKVVSTATASSEY